MTSSVLKIYLALILIMVLNSDLVFYDLRGRPCTQYSQSANGVCSRAIDGNTNGVYTAGSCTHTDRDTGPYTWWQVDLQECKNIKAVVLYNRAGDTYNRLSYFKVYIGYEALSPGNSGTGQNRSLCYAQDAAVANGGSVTCNCATSLPGRYVTVEKTDPRNGRDYYPLTLCEVEVYVEEKSQPLSQRVFEFQSNPLPLIIDRMAQRRLIIDYTEDNSITKDTDIEVTITGTGIPCVTQYQTTGVIMFTSAQSVTINGDLCV